ncbi:MAG: MBL fold metallo-hydrolase [Desulfomonilia bacterium]|jgi:glyoxylase-like metal-dependent hydrolase (beta-lactamase superfamily II)
MAAETICEGVYLVGGASLSHFEDAMAFAVECSGELVLIDSGAGRGARALEMNIRSIAGGTAKPSTLILTHCHVDHIGSAKHLRDAFGCRVLAHELDAGAIETGDPALTAASWYGIALPKTPVDRRLKGDHEIITAADGQEFHCLHTPGHTPGSISVYLDRGGKRVLFGQDIHGPFSDEFNSDIALWRESMERLLELEADILCEGHFGIFTGKDRVRRYIQDYLDRYAGEY